MNGWFRSATILLAALMIPAGAAEYYSCEDGETLPVVPVGDGDAIVMRVDGEWRLLPRVRSASGVKFTDGSLLFWSKGPHALLEKEGVVLFRACREVDPKRAGSRSNRTLLDLPIHSSIALDVDPINARIDDAGRRGDTWVSDPLQIALRCVGASQGRLASLCREYGPGEHAASATVRMAREGLLDDSLQSIWDELHFVLTEQGSWLVTEARRAYRCRRGSQTDHFGADLCP